jgi:alpha-mannosidase
MYVEADCNITGGEGLVRQFMYGKRFFKQEFGVDSKVLWLPDVFGYSAALPQIMKKCGVDDFVTSKISWNDTNTMPYDTFSWQGIDGSEVVTHFILGQHDANWKAHTTYVSHVTPASVYGTYFRNQQRQVSDQALMTVGYGDGGGGTTTYDIEYVERMKNPLPALPSARFISVKEYIDTAKANIAKNEKELPKWIGELYLEYHRGTYTSQANNKKYNRKSEFGMCNVEALSVLANKFGIDGFDKAEHDKKWEDILINQFHDILPGSSINEVYKDSDYMYGKIFEYINGMTQKLLNGIAKNVQSSGFLVYNPNSFTLNGTVTYDGKRYKVEDVPAKGYKVVSLKESKSKVKASKNVLENAFIKLTLDKNKNIVSVYDKKNDREVLKKGKSIRFVAYEDLPNNYDAWEIAHYYKEKEFAVNDVVSCEVVKDNCGAGIKTVRKLGDSVITDTVYLYDDKDIVEFDDNVDWKESHVLLKR